MECDIVVVGATGYTGALVVESLARGRGGRGVGWSVAARSPSKMRELVDTMRGKGLDISAIPQHTVDVNDNESLVRALSGARVVLNCVGPNTRYSAPVVAACLATHTHYVDMSAEINHILSLYVEYHKEAEAANILIIPSTAFASLVVASGYIYLKDQFEGQLSQVECYAELGLPLVSYIPCTGALASCGTWDSLVHVLLNLKQYQREKARVFSPIELPKEMRRGFHWQRRSLWFPYPGPDEDVMEFSERYLQEKRQKTPTHFKLYTRMPMFLHYLFIPAMFFYFYLCYFNWFANLLRRYPRVSSKDPYGSTAVLMIVAAITILKNQSQMPSGGVVNVGAAFYDTKIVDQLKAAGFQYEILLPKNL